MERKVRVRFAPSPTGPLHIGGVRTALYNYLFARRNGGDMVLRIEDTDSARFVPGAEQYITEALSWLGITFDEGVVQGGPFGPYRQSERRQIYKKYVRDLLDSGKAYLAFDTPEELEKKRRETANFQYDASTRLSMRNSLSLPPSEVKSLIDSGARSVVRFKVEPGQEIIVDDLIRGRVSVMSDILDDKVLFKSSDELPTYHLANIVDDHLMEITHVIRGEEWLPSAPLHVLLYKAFGWQDSMPQFAHLPLLLKPEGKGKLSKRDGDRLGFPVFPLEWNDPKSGDLSSGFREKGYFPEALVNFLAFLGWNPGSEREIYSLEELVSLFDLSKCSKSGARFDFQKAVWFNHEYILMKSPSEIAALFEPILEANGINESRDRVTQVASMMKDRVNFVSELWPLCKFFFVAPQQYDPKTVAKRWHSYSPSQMDELACLLDSLDDFSVESQEKAVSSWMEAKGYKAGDIMNAWRLSLVGEGKGPGMYDISAFLGKQETIARMRQAIRVLATPAL